MVPQEKQILQVDYMPITFSGNTPEVAAVALDGGVAMASGGGPSSAATAVLPTPSTQMYIRIANTGSRCAIELATVKVKYWFHGPDPALYPYTSTPGNAACSEDTPCDSLSVIRASPFKLRCLYVSPELRGGCNALRWWFKPGVSGVPGARYVMTISFEVGVGALACNATTAAEAEAAGNPPGCPGLRNRTAALLDGLPLLPDVEMVVSIETMHSELLDARKDYSFLDTPVLSRTASFSPQPGQPAPNTTAIAAAMAANNISTNSGLESATDGWAPDRQIVLRQTEPNHRITGYVNSVIVWGGLPSPVRQPVPPGTCSSASECALAREQMPVGSSCSTMAEGGLDCHVVMPYCCTAEEPVATRAPQDWQGLFWKK